jgi:predicted nucleic acid-binding protein
VSLYVTDQNSPEARRLILSAPSLPFTPLHKAEWTHVISHHVFRSQLSTGEADRMHAKLEEHILSGRWLAVPVPEKAFNVCAELARLHGPKLGMRTLDSLHVACALELEAEQFWTYDERQSKLAKAQGFKII